MSNAAKGATHKMQFLLQWMREWESLRCSSDFAEPMRSRRPRVIHRMVDEPSSRINGHQSFQSFNFKLQRTL